MRTLFLQAPSFDGFDGGAGSRYQARREIRSFWYPTWLAQPAALVEGSKLVDAPPHGIKLAEVTASARDYDLVVLHTSAPSFASDVATIKALKEANSALKIGLVGAKVAVDPAGTLNASPLIDFVARNEFDFTIKEIADGRSVERYRRPVLSQFGRRHRAQRRAPDPGEHGQPALRHAGLQARPRHRELFHRLPEAPVSLDLHRTRLQIALHLLPVAADGRRPSLPHALGRPRHRGDRLGAEGLPRGEGVLFRRRHLHRRFAARRSHRQGARPSSA